MAEKVVLEAEIKSNIGDVTKETKELTNNFGFFGVSIGDVKDKFKDVAKIMKNGLTQVALQAKLAGVGFKKMFSGNIIGGAKTLFSVIKTGIIATGIGAFVIVITSLIGHLLQTKKGAELLERTLATIGAAVSVITDRIAGLGGAVIKFFKGDFKGAAAEAAAAVKNVTGEIIEETKATNKLVGANQKLKDSQRALNVETAQSIAQVEQLKLIAEDITKTYAEREKAATQAFNIEKGLEDKRIKIAAEAVALEKERQAMMGKDGVMAEDLDALSELEINLANVRQESAGRQLSLQNFLNGLRNEELAKIKEIRDAEDERTAGLEKMTLAVKDLIDETEHLQKADESVLVQAKTSKEKRKQFDKEVLDSKINIGKDGLKLASELATEGSKLSKALLKIEKSPAKIALSPIVSVPYQPIIVIFIYIKTLLSSHIFS